MTLSIEQFNKLVTKEEHLELKKEFKEVHQKIDMIFDVVCGITDKIDKFDQKLTVNQVAHDSFETRISKLESNI